MTDARCKRVARVCRPRCRIAISAALLTGHGRMLLNSPVVPASEEAQ
jgi:hypothetical protein